ncbi:MAG: hypothetical protein VYE68_07995 [Acidobacteriota bacterium]|nr:hypothetical protein [Acidobacteriota bacterium]
MTRRRSLVGLVTLAVLGAGSPAQAQSACWFLCAPVLKIEPTLTVENLLWRGSYRGARGADRR